jgi:hypothetical protein
VFHQANLSRRMPDRRPPLRSGNVADVCWDVSPGPQVCAHEDDPAARRGRYESKAYGSASQETDAAHLHGPGNGTLLAMIVPSHVCLILVRCHVIPDE